MLKELSGVSDQLENVDKRDLDHFGNEFQEKLVNLMIIDRQFCDQLLEVFEVKYLSKKHHQKLIELLIEYKRQYNNTHPSLDTMRIMCNSLELDNEALQGKIVDLFQKIRKRDSVDLVQDAEFVKQKSLDFCRTQKLLLAMFEAIPLALIETPQFDTIQTKIAGALRLGTENNAGLDLKKDFDIRLVEDYREAFSTGWTAIDSITDGGIGRSELWVMLAPTGAGKSMHLVSVAKSAAVQGLKVVYFTLELKDKVIGKRFDSCLTGIPTKEIVENKELVREKINDLKGEIVIKEWPMKSKSTRAIDNYIEKMAANEGIPDLVVIDYADLLKPVEANKDGRVSLDVSNIYEELKAIAQKYNCAVLTASQTNRKAEDVEIITNDHVASSYDKLFPSDMVMTISKKRKVYVSKNRNGPTDLVFNEKVDFSRALIEIGRDEDEFSLDTEAEFAESLLEINREDANREIREYLKSKGK